MRAAVTVKGHEWWRDAIGKILKTWGFDLISQRILLNSYHSTMSLGCRFLTKDVCGLPSCYNPKGRGKKKTKQTPDSLVSRQS